MAIIDIKRTVSLDGAIMPVALEGTLYGGENQAHRFIINATKDGALMNLTGSVTASFLRKADDAEVPLTGEIIGGAAAVTLLASCYAVPGRFELTIFVTSGGSKTAVYNVNGNVKNTSAGKIVDPGHVVPDISDIVAEYARMQAASDAAEAAAANANEAAQFATDDEWTNGDTLQTGRVYQTLHMANFEEETAGQYLRVISGNVAQAERVNQSGWSVYRYDLPHRMLIRLESIEKNTPTVQGVLPMAAVLTSGSTETLYSLDSDRTGTYVLADALLVNYSITLNASAIKSVSITAVANRQFEDVIVCLDHAAAFDKIVVFGDSIFANYINSTTVGNGVMAQFAALMGLPVENNAVGGATLSTIQTSPKNVVQQVQDYIASATPGGTPLYMIDGGTNDQYNNGAGLANLGQYTDGVNGITNTIYGATYKIINDLLGFGAQPWQIVITTPIPKGIRGDAAYTATMDAQLTAIAGAMAEIAMVQQCNLINGYGSPFDNLTTDTAKAIIMSDDTHPSVYGAKLYAERIFRLLGTAMQPEVAALKSALGEQTYNLVVGKYEHATIDSSGRRVSLENTDIWAAQVEEGKTYTVKTVDVGGLVCAFFTENPATAPSPCVSYNNERVIQTSNHTITSPINGYIGFRATSGEREIQIVEGNVDKPYLPPVTAQDYVARAEIDRLSDAQIFITDTIGSVNITFKQGSIPTTGSTIDWETPQKTAGYEYAVAECNPGDMFDITGAGGGSARLYAFIGDDSPASVVGDQAPSFIETVNAIIKTPNGAKKLIINAQSNKEHTVIKRTKTETTADLESVLESVNLFDRTKAIHGYSLNPAAPGSVQTNIPTDVSDYIKVSPMQKYFVSFSEKIAFYDKDKVYISTTTGTDITTPANCEYIRFSYSNESENAKILRVYKIGEQNKRVYTPYELTVTDKTVKEKIIDYSGNLLTPFVNVYEGYSIYASGNNAGQMAVVPSCNCSDYIPVEGGATYTFSKRWTLAWYNSDKEFISGVGASDIILTQTAPAIATYMRFSWINSDNISLSVNKGDALLPWNKQAPKIKKEYLPSIRGLSVICLKKPEESLNTPKNLSLIAGKIIQKEGSIPDCAGYLFLEESTQKLYYSSNTTDNPKYLCDWDNTLANNEECKYWCATITADNDIIFLRDHARRNPIIYPHGDYSNPYVIDFGDDKKPYGWLMSGSVVQFEDGSFVFGDYAWHSLEDEENDDRRIIWRVEKPYAKANWVQAHSFKHVYPSSSQSDEPDNEIGHIHAIMYDFYADDLYCTTGDIDRHCRMWISDDHGETWAAVPGAVGTTENTTVQAEGQKWRMTGSIFLKDYMYWATDSFFENHNLWRCKRGNEGHIDFSTLEKICNLEIGITGPQSQATYVTALIRNPYGLLIIDRAEPRTDGLLDIKFYDLNTGELSVIGTFERATGALGNLDQEKRVGLPNQFVTLYQPQSMDCVPIGGSKYIRVNNTTIFNNSLENYVGGLKLKVT